MPISSQRVGEDGDRAARLAASLEERTLELTERWHQELKERLRIRPANVFPTSKLLDGMPALIRWVAGTLRNGQALGREHEQSAHALAHFWRDSGYSIEESLLHIGILGGILHEALQDAVAREFPELEATEGMQLTEKLCRSLNRIETVLVGTYRDEEEQRFADFGGTLAHEIRGQLNVAMTAAELLEIAGTDPSDAAQAQRDLAVGRVTGAIESVAELVSAVRSFSQARSGLQEWTLRPFDELVEDVIERLRAESAGDVHLKLETDVPSVVVPGEAVQLALHNLVENAVKYADPEKDEQWVRIHVLEEPEHHRWLVQIGDNGIGIPEEEQERIFARFLRGSRAQGRGFGLGLSIARQAALSVGGTVMLESREGEGSTFSFTIPFDNWEEPRRA